MLKYCYTPSDLPQRSPVKEATWIQSPRGQTRPFEPVSRATPANIYVPSRIYGRLTSNLLGKKQCGGFESISTKFSQFLSNSSIPEGYKTNGSRPPKLSRLSNSHVLYKDLLQLKESRTPAHGNRQSRVQEIAVSKASKNNGKYFGLEKLSFPLKTIESPAHYCMFTNSRSKSKRSPNNSKSRLASSQTVRSKDKMVRLSSNLKTSSSQFCEEGLGGKQDRRMSYAGKNTSGSIQSNRGKVAKSKGIKKVKIKKEPKSSLLLEQSNRKSGVELSFLRVWSKRARESGEKIRLQTRVSELEIEVN
jgi:hypothetical protein